MVRAFRRSAVFCFTASIDSNRVPFKTAFIFGNKKKSHGAKSGKYGACWSTGVRLSAKYRFTDSALWAGALSKSRTVPNLVSTARVGALECVYRQNTASQITRYGQVRYPGAKSTSCSSITRAVSYELVLTFLALTPLKDTRTR